MTAAGPPAPELDLAGVEEYSPAPGETNGHLPAPGSPAVALPAVRPTMRDVAAAAGVGIKTVSRVVNGEPCVSPETAARVRAAIADLDFRLNDVARSLRRGQPSKTIGLVIGDVSNHFYSAITRAVEDVAAARNFMVITGSSDESPQTERELVLSLCRRRVDGLIVVPAGADHRYLLPEIDMGVRAVFIDRPPGNIAADIVVVDNARAAHSAVAHLIAHGHRRIALIGDLMSIHTQAERRRGYRAALTAARLPYDSTLVRINCHSAGQAEAAVRDLLALPDPPTALFTTNNIITLGALRALGPAATTTALVGLDDFDFADLLPVPVTVVRHGTGEMGRRAAELVFARLDGDDAPPRTVVLPTELVARGSGEIAPALSVSGGAAAP